MVWGLIRTSLTEQRKDFIGHFPVAAIATDMTLHLESLYFSSRFFIEFADGPDIMVGDHHLNPMVCKSLRRLGQKDLVVPVESAHMVISEISGLAQWRIGRIAIDDVTLASQFQSGRKIGMQEGCLFCRSVEPPHRVCRQSGF